jgi:shikimate kinase
MTTTPTIDSSGSTSAPPIVVLTGFMGSGKTTAGRALAEMLLWEFVDLDEWIEREQQTSIREIFERFGETEFRKIEQSALRRVLAECSCPTVLALGGGTFAQSNNGPVLRREGLRTVFLEVSVEEMLKRCAGEEGEAHIVRPLAVDQARFRELYELRLESYRKADFTVSAELLMPGELAREIAARLQLDPVG